MSPIVFVFIRLLTGASICMEISCNNFENNYAAVETAIKTATFIAVDIEFLGLDTDDIPSRCSLFDSPSERFAKQRASVLRFPPAQWGFALFTAHDDGQTYQVDVYNVYLFKKGYTKQEFSFSVASLSFLDSHGFDFNKLVCEGVSHVNLDELTHLLAQFKTSYNGIDAFGDDLRELLSTVQRQLHARLARVRRKSTGSEGAQSRAFEPFSFPITKEPLSELQKTALLHKLYATVPGIRMNIDGNVLEVDSTRLTKRELANIRDGLLKKLTRGLMGASEIMLTIVEARLPIVGHNCFYDLMYMYQYFIADLPEDYVEFKRAINTVFPVVIDTKILAEASKHKLSWHGVLNFRLESLGNYFDSKLSESAVPQPRFELGSVSPQRRNSGRKGAGYHNAAFDALTTGKTFVKLAHLVANPLQRLDLDTCLHMKTLLYGCRPYSNRVPVPLLGVPYINLIGSDPPSRNPEEIVLEMIADDDQLDLDSIRKELRSQFGRWRCDVRVDGARVRLATNTDTTYRRVYNYFSMHPSYRLLSSESSTPTSSGSSTYDSQPGSPRRPSSPRNASCGTTTATGSSGASSGDDDESSARSSPSKTIPVGGGGGGDGMGDRAAVRWALCAGSVLLSVHLLSRSPSVV